MLGLKTLSETKELREYTGHRITDEDREEQDIYDNFRAGNTDGIFQMEKSAPKKK
jgi:DNA polymerase III alpha subunit